MDLLLVERCPCLLWSLPVPSSKIELILHKDVKRSACSVSTDSPYNAL